MSTYLLAIGINHYTDRAFRALSCCENDASEIHALFKRNLELGDRASKLVGAVSIADVKNELRRIGQEIRNGDTFVLFFAGHGYQHPKREDQFLLFPEAEARLVNKGYLDGMLSLSALCELTEHWAGVARVFILDACRSWLPGRDASGARFDNEAALAYIASRDPAFGPDNAKPTDSLNAPGGALPPVILNATRNGQEAKELEDRQRGVLALALEQALESQHKSGEVIWLGEQMLTDINQRMNALLQHGRLGVEQTPFLTPPTARILLFKPQRITEALNTDDDETEWAITVAENSVEAYKVYARRKPPGKYRDDALRRISEIASNDASKEQQAKTNRDEARRQQALAKIDLAGWQKALKEAETEEFRTEARGQIAWFEQEAARSAEEDDRRKIAALRSREALEQQVNEKQRTPEEAERPLKEEAVADEAEHQAKEATEEKLRGEHAEREQYEEHLWLTAQSENTLAGYNQYLKKTLSGKYNNEAKRARSRLQVAENARKNEVGQPDKATQEKTEPEKQSAKLSWIVGAVALSGAGIAFFTNENSAPPPVAVTAPYATSDELTHIAPSINSSVSPPKKPDAAQEDFVDGYLVTAPGVVKDPKTGLEWMRCSLGQKWDESINNCAGDALEYNFISQAEKAASDINQIKPGGYNNWRLPTIGELESIRYCRNGYDGKIKIGNKEAPLARQCNFKNLDLAIKNNSFKNIQTTRYLSSSYSDSSKPFILEFYGGLITEGSNPGYAARLVRSEKNKSAQEPKPQPQTREIKQSPELSPKQVRALLSGSSDPWVRENFKKLNCEEASIRLGELEYGYEYNFNLSISAKERALGINEVRLEVAERGDFNGSDSFPKLEFTKELKDAEFKIQPWSTIRSTQTDNKYKILYRPDDKNYNDEHPDLILAYKVRRFEYDGKDWLGPYERVSSCILYKISGRL